MDGSPAKDAFDDYAFIDNGDILEYTTDDAYDLAEKEGFGNPEEGNDNRCIISAWLKKHGCKNGETVNIKKEW